MESCVQDTVHFRIRDAVHPSPVQLLDQLYGEGLLEGKVVASTDDGQAPANFRVVKVPGVGEYVIVPAQKVQASPEPEPIPEGRFVSSPEKGAAELTTPTSDLRLH